jgi:hypothetical protein
LPSGEEIQASLRAFVGRWEAYAGSERGEAQTFLNELFGCYGTDRRDVGARFEDFVTSAGFLDLHWPGICIVEMKAPARPVSDAQPQLERYWRESSKPDDGIGAARWVILCNFRQIEIWEPGRFPTRAVTTFDLADLPDRYDALAFLAGPHLEPNFSEHYRELTREAAKVVAGVYQSLVDRAAALQRDVQRFILQSVWCMFADDLQMMEDFPFQATLNAAAADPDNSAALVGYLFTVLNQKTNANRTGRLAGTRYVNGELFAEPAYVQLNHDEIRQLLEASAFDWRKVDPTIFGSLMEGVLGRERRWELGAHYTHEVDIMKIVGPTIVRPWRERIAATSTPQQARDLLDELCAFKVLDPACGCGNFLYVAYRELRGLEHEVKQRIQHLATETGLPVPAGVLPFYPLRNVQGIDLERAAVQIARVTLWMGHRQMIERYGEAEPALPLQDLSGIQQADALKVAWPETDCIVGNPPFLGASHVRHGLGDVYVEWLKSEFGVGIKDLCTYWFRRAADHLRPGQRAGLVGTNSISQNLGRSASLDYVAASGGVITDAVSSQKWPGDAKVHVSIVNWVDEPAQPVGGFVLDGVPVVGITTSLTDGVGGWTPHPLAANKGRCFEGPSPKAKGLLISEEEARRLLAEAGADYPHVVRPYLTAKDLTDDPAQAPSRWAIDFRLMNLEEAMRYPAALAIVRARVKPERETNRRKVYREKWWIFAEPRRAMRGQLEVLDRFIALPGHAKRMSVGWMSSDVLASNATDVFAFDDDYSMGILLSKAHDAWAWAQASTLKGDLRYTPTSVFMTFPWPDPVTDEQRERVAEASRRLLARRTEICAAEQIGLTKLYNAVDDGAWTDLKALHKHLDEAVAECYGWPHSVAQDPVELVRRLTERNREIVEDGRPYDPFRELDVTRSPASDQT